MPGRETLMPPDLPTRLARKWCAYCYGGNPRVADPDHHYHDAIATAVREALEEAEKQRIIALTAITIVDNLWHKVNRTMADLEAGQFALERAIAALREGRDV